MDLEVDRRDLHHVRVVDVPAAELHTGQARLKVDSFALTSNNITYAVFGDMLRYWDVFPAADDDGGTEWGRVPVWGFADVVESTVGALSVGTRVYGYLPMSTDVVITPGRFDERGFSDVADHRADLAAAYNRYAFTAVDPVYSAEHEAHHAVLWPLFFTAFVIDDFLDDTLIGTGRLGGDDGSGTVLISSASSKTAIGAAFLLSQRTGLHVVGLTSPGNAAFVAELGCYHEVVTYDALHLLPDGVAAFVDIAGDQVVTRAVHQHYGDRLLHSMIVGGTHWDVQAQSTALPPGPLPGPVPEFFFAPTQLAKRAKEWGRAGLEVRTVHAWEAYRTWVAGWLRFRASSGPAEVEHTYRELLAGRVDATIGHVCTMGPS
ncbi:MAG: DUF2855 family protein [Actinomycetota bacterium]|nr:DUF2855 family protein [Actinomycetota bacterium]